MVRREKQTIFLDATEETTVLQLKKMLESIVKRIPDDQKLYNVDTKDTLEDSKTLGDCGYKSQNSKAQDPASIGLAFRTGKVRVAHRVVHRRESPGIPPASFSPPQNS